LLIFVKVLFFQSSNAQKVGLVLSGGVAKGLAHIGIIKALEENEIPIDYITGTSMGAIIGSLYAVGYSPEEMEKLVVSEDFEKLANGILEEKDIYYFKRKEINSSQISFKFQKTDSVVRLKIPLNIIPSHRIDFAFMEIFAGAIAYAEYDFNNLFVPFRCITTDIYEDKEVIFKKGQLPSAVRASMSFPFYFHPMTIEGKLLFDGGILNNFPYDVMDKEFKPDIIIGSKAVSGFNKPEENEVLLIIINMIVERTNYNIPEEKGILIEPKLKDVEIFDYNRAEEIIKRGYNAANLKMSEIRRRIKSKIN